jgi:ABC-type nitrate/sulfonate/bicarbonate transport system permease component
MTLPSLQGTRSLPPVAAVPFFLLWFGFSDIGRWLLVVVGVSANLSFAAYQVLLDMPDKYVFALTSLGIEKKSLPWNISLPLVLEHLLPTLRFSLSTAIGLIVVSELLGSQVGLGYLIQSARSTFSLQTIFLCAILLGLMNGTLDWSLVRLWKAVVFWRQT